LSFNPNYNKALPSQAKTNTSHSSQAITEPFIALLATTLFRRAWDSNHYPPLI
jgi:hypothetical protein